MTSIASVESLPVSLQGGCTVQSTLAIAVSLPGRTRTLGAADQAGIRHHAARPLGGAGPLVPAAAQTCRKPLHPCQKAPDTCSSLSARQPQQCRIACSASVSSTPSAGPGGTTCCSCLQPAPHRWPLRPSAPGGFPQLQHQLRHGLAAEPPCRRAARAGPLPCRCRPGTLTTPRGQTSHCSLRWKLLHHRRPVVSNSHVTG